MNSCNFLENNANEFTREALTDTTYTALIPQKIGGTLICRVNYSDDFHSWNYYVDYKYKDSNNQVFSLGSGLYSGKDWYKDEQIQVIGDWAILKTGSIHHSDKLIIWKLNQAKDWKEFDFTPETIESEQLWQSRNIKSDPNNYDSKVSVESIDSKGIVTVNYSFAKKDRLFSFITGERKVLYRIDQRTGKPTMADIVEE
jgi:hypothetical protein